MRLFRPWLARLSALKAQRGVTLVELAAVSAIMIVMAGVTYPVANTMVKRQKELELRRALRTIRTALDQFEYDYRRFPNIRISMAMDRANEEGYPEDLAWLYEGVDIGDAAGTKLKYLRRLPLDPMTGDTDWTERSSRDDPESLFSDGINIFDVRSRSEKIGLDGTRYNTW